MTLPVPVSLEESQSPQRAHKKSRLGFILRLCITLLLFAVLLRSVSWSMVLTTLAHLDQERVLIGLAFGMAGIIVSSAQWQSLLRAERITVGLVRLVGLYLVGIGFSHFLPTGMGGDVVKAIYVGREAGNGPGAASAVVMSRVTGFMGMLAIAFVVLLFWFAYFNRTVVLWFLLLSLLVSVLIWGAILSTALLARIAKSRWLSAITRNRLVSSIITSAIQIGDAIRVSSRRPRSMSIATLLGLLFWITGCLNYYGYALALHMTVPLYFYFVAVPFASLVTFLPISINGFGVRESAFVYAFSTVHVPVATSLLLVFLVDLQVLCFGAIGGYLYLTMSNKVSTMQPSRNVDTSRPLMHDYTNLQHPPSAQSSSGVEAMQSGPAALTGLAQTPIWQVPTQQLANVTAAPGPQSMAPPAPPPEPPRSRQLRQKLVVIIAALVCLLVLLVGIGLYTTLHAAPGVTLYQVGSQNVSQSIGGGGIVFPRQQMDISFPNNERVTAVLVQAGDQVTINQPLIQLDATQLNAQIAQAANDLAAAQVYYNQVLASGNAIEIAQAQQAYNLAKDKYDALVAQSSSPILHNDMLVSPISGVVTAINITPGQVFVGNTPLLTIMDDSKVIVHVNVPLSDLGQVRLGQSAQVTPSALPNLTFDGTVSAVIPQADPQTDTFQVWVQVVNTNQTLLPGMSAFVRIERSGTAMVVPRLAVLDAGHNSIVFVVRNQHAYIQHVHVAGRSVDSFFVDGGISAGDEVVLVGADNLQNGQAVRVTRVEAA